MFVILMEAKVCIDNNFKAPDLQQHLIYGNLLDELYLNPESHIKKI